MLAFTDHFKIYLHKDRSEVKLSIRVSSQVVDSYRLEQAAFEQLLQACDDRQGCDITSCGIDWFAQRKHQGRPTEYVRISAWFAGACRDYRANASDVTALAEEYQRQQSNAMPWDQQ